MADIWANYMACHSRATCHIAGCCHVTYSVSWSQSYMSHCRVLPPGEFNGMSSQSHVSLFRVLPLGEFTVMIPEPHATLQGVRIPSAILKIVFAIFYFFCFLNAVCIVSNTLVFAVNLFLLWQRWVGEDKWWKFLDWSVLCQLYQ